MDHYKRLMQIWLMLSDTDKERLIRIASALLRQVPEENGRSARKDN